MYSDLGTFCAVLCGAVFVVNIDHFCRWIVEFVERKRFERWLAKASEVGR